MKPIYLILLGTAIFIAGCSEPQSTLTDAREVRGKITFEGEPLANAKVVFVPQKLMSEKRKVIPLAYGMTDESGSFVLKLSDGTVNIVKGNYRVIISKRNDPGQEIRRLPDLVNKFENLVPDEFALFRDKIVHEETLPTRYNERTILEFKVEPDLEILTANFDLTN